jgi:GTP cyclohydrolase II
MSATADYSTTKSSPHSLLRQADAMIPTPWGNFRMFAYADHADDWMPHLALVHEGCDSLHPVLVRIHSECITGDLFGSKKCDCGEQLHQALQMIAANKGILLYLRQEGRGIGIINKLKAYQLQEKGYDTIHANLHLGLEVDARQYSAAVAMLQDLGVHEIELITNNPDKIDAFDQSGISIRQRVPIVVQPQEENMDYLRTKQTEMGHLFDIL